MPKYGIGGVVEPPGCAPKKPPGEDMEGGEAGDAGPPLEVNGGLICFSFCLLLKKVWKKLKFRNPHVIYHLHMEAEWIIPFSLLCS